MLRKTFFLLCISISATAQIGAKLQQQSKIFGLWQNNQFGYQMTLMLNPDGSGEFDGQPITFVTQGSKLSLSIGAVTTNYSFNLQGNTLTLSGGDLSGQVAFTRNGAGNESGNALTEARTQAYSNTDSNLVGLWSGNGEMIEFKADGKCVYLGNTFPYQTSKGHLILSSAQGNVMFSYEVKGSQLTLSGSGGQVVYNKAVGTSVETGSQNNQRAGGGVAMEIVGKWCYMNMSTNSQSERCITLNGDGTYLYHTEGSMSVNTNEFSGGTASQGDDRGTWYVQGDRLFYNSQSQGQGSVSLEKRNHPKNVNDPMLVLNGEFFVTATLRNPWR